MNFGDITIPVWMITSTIQGLATLIQQGASPEEVARRIELMQADFSQEDADADDAAKGHS